MSDDYYETRQPALYASTGVLLCLATIAVFLRLLARRKSAACFWWEYVFITPPIHSYADCEIVIQ